MSQINKWTIDFAQAKIALRNLENLVNLQSQCQLDVFGRLKALYLQYETFARQNDDGESKGAITEQISLFQHIEHNIHMTTAKFSGKAAAQLDAARSQVNAIYHTLGKLRSLKPPQYTEVSDQLTQQIPEFLNLFDAFLARFTLEIRLQQADFLKELGSTFTHLGQPEPIKAILEKWLTEYTQIMPAVEALKTVSPQPGLNPPGVIAAGSNENSGAKFQNETVDSVLFASVKWVHSKVTRDLREFKFSDPRKGFFDKPTQPPKHEKQVVRAIFDFKGETDSDLMFKKGDVIFLVDKGTVDDPNWWCGEYKGKRGLFPRNYVEEIPIHENVNQESWQIRDAGGQLDEYIPQLQKHQDKPDSQSQNLSLSWGDKDLISPYEGSTVKSDNSKNLIPSFDSASEKLKQVTDSTKDLDLPAQSKTPQQVSLAFPLSPDSRTQGSLKASEAPKSTPIPEAKLTKDSASLGTTANPQDVPIEQLRLKEDNDASINDELL